MYKVKGCLLASVGFRGYFGGFPASCVISDNELASMLGAIMILGKERVRARYRAQELLKKQTQMEKLLLQTDRHSGDSRTAVSGSYKRI